MEQLSPLDAAFIYLESPRTAMHIGGVYLIDRASAGPDFGYETVRAHVESRLQVARTFRQRLLEVPLAMGHPYWVEDPDFDLEAHLPRYTLARPGGKLELMKLAAEIFSRPLSRQRPLWETAYVEGLDAYPGMSGGSIALVARVHHAAVDGVSGAEIMGALLDPTPRPVRELPPDEWRPDRLPTGIELAARSYAKLGARAVEAAGVLGRAVRGMGKILGETLGGETALPVLPLRAPRTPLNEPVSDSRSFGGIDFDLDRIKAIRATVPGATVNDVLLAVCSGALRRWLMKRQALPERPLVAMVPVSVRPREQRRELGNQVSAMLVELATEIDDPHLRLAAIRRSTRSAKGHGRALPANRLMDLVPSETAALASRLYTRLKIAERHRPLFNLVITNVPGPQIPIYLAGARVHGHLGMAPVFDGMGLILVIFSLSGRLSIGITACSDVLEDSGELEEMLTDALEELEREPAVDGDLLTEAVAKRHRHPEIAALHSACDRLSAAIERLDRDLEEEE